jgi:PEP-CTERM motif
MNSLTKYTLRAVILAALFLTCSSMNAQAKTIISDAFTVYNQNHQIAFSSFVTKDQEELNGASTIYYIENDDIADPNQWGNYTSVLKSPTNLTMSDAFGVASRGSEFLLFFLSDTSTEPCPYPPGPNTVFEQLLPSGRYGGIFDATMYLSPDLQSQGWTASFESGMPVPEPATVLLMGSGIGALILLKRRSTKS